MRFFIAFLALAAFVQGQQVCLEVRINSDQGVAENCSYFQLKLLKFLLQAGINIVLYKNGYDPVDLFDGDGGRRQLRGDERQLYYCNWASCHRRRLGESNGGQGQVRNLQDDPLFFDLNSLCSDEIAEFAARIPQGTCLNSFLNAACEITPQP